MTTWLMGIVGVVAVGVLLEILLENTEIAKYIKGVFALALVFVIVSPLPSLFKNGFDLNKIFSKTAYVPDYEFVENIGRLTDIELVNTITEILKEKDIDVYEINIVRGEDRELLLIKIYTREYSKKEQIIEIVSGFVNISEDKIKVYQKL